MRAPPPPDLIACLIGQLSRYKGLWRVALCFLAALRSSDWTARHPLKPRRTPTTRLSLDSDELENGVCRAIVYCRRRRTGRARAFLITRILTHTSRRVTLHAQGGHPADSCAFLCAPQIKVKHAKRLTSRPPATVPLYTVAYAHTRPEWMIGRGVGFLRGSSSGWCVRCSPHG